MRPPRLKTNKLFFKKWPYKISCGITGAWLIRAFGSAKVANMTPDVLESFTYRNNLNHMQKALLKEFAELTSEYFKNESIRTRIDSRSVDFYLENLNQCDIVLNKLEKFVISVTEPKSNEVVEYLKNNTNQIICNKYPFGKYQYKVTFKEMPIKVRNNLIEWAEKYDNDDIHIKESTKIHFKGIKHRWGTHYFYVKNNKIITLISLIVAGYISKTEQFVIKKF